MSCRDPGAPLGPSCNWHSDCGLFRSLALLEQTSGPQTRPCTESCAACTDVEDDVGKSQKLTHNKCVLTFSETVHCTGWAALIELASEPLFVLAQLELRFRLRVGIEAAANLAKAGLSLALLQSRSLDELSALCFAQVK